MYKTSLELYLSVMLSRLSRWADFNERHENTLIHEEGHSLLFTKLTDKHVSGKDSTIYYIDGNWETYFLSQ